MTSASVGWVLLDGNGPDAAALDHDAFDVSAGTDDTAGETAQHTAAVRGAQSIATTSGHNVGSVRVTWTEDIDADAKTFVKSLAGLGFDNVLAMPLSKAGQAWGLEAGRESKRTKCGICILEPDAATVMIVATEAGSVRTAVTENRDSADDLIDWMRTVFREDGWLPESLYLVGSRRDLDEVAQPIADALPIPVLDTVDAQLALARGAALAAATQLDTAASPVVATKRDRARQVLPAKEPTDAPATTAVQTPVRLIKVLSNGPQRRARPWLVAHARKVTITAAGVAVVGAALSLAAGSAFNGDNVSAQAADPAIPDASVTSASIHTVPAPAAAAPAPVAVAAQPLAAAPPPAPTEALPPAPVTHTAGPLAAVPQSIAVPSPQHSTVSSQRTTAVSPSAAPLTAPAVTPPAAAPLAAPASVTPPAAAPLAAPASVTPPAAAPLAAPAAVVPPPAAVPIAPPAAGAAVPPAPAAAPPAPAPAAADSPDPAPPPDSGPPPDPIQTVLSPLFSGLP